MTRPKAVPAETWAKLTPAEREFAVRHEEEHKAARDRAIDELVNRELMRLGAPLPASIGVDPRFEGKSVKEIYEMLRGEPQGGEEGEER